MTKMTLVQIKNKKSKKGGNTMKKKLKKVVSIALALIALFALSLTAFAADISAEDAKSIAVSDAGYSLSDVLYIRAEYEIDDGRRHWNVDFLVEDEKGRKVDYDYEVSASDGRILERDYLEIIGRCGCPSTDYLRSHCKVS